MVMMSGDARMSHILYLRIRHDCYKNAKVKACSGFPQCLEGDVSSTVKGLRYGEIR